MKYIGSLPKMFTNIQYINLRVKRPLIQEVTKKRGNVLLRNIGFTYFPKQGQYNILYNIVFKIWSRYVNNNLIKQERTLEMRIEFKLPL